jgi:hypothetical protein
MGSSNLVSHPETPPYYQSRKQGLRISGQFRTSNSKFSNCTLHPVVPNPYMLLGFVPAEVKFFTCLDLKDTFFCIHLAPQSQLPMGKSQHWGKRATNLDLVDTRLQKFTHYFWNCPGI